MQISLRSQDLYFKPDDADRKSTKKAQWFVQLIRGWFQGILMHGIRYVTQHHAKLPKSREWWHGNGSASRGGAREG